MPIDLSLPSIDGWDWRVCHIIQIFDSFSLLDQLAPVSPLKPISWSTGLSSVTTTRRLATFIKSFCGLPIGSFLTFKGPLVALAKTPQKCLVSCLLTFQQYHFKLSVGPGHAGIPGNKHALSVHNAGTSLPTVMVSCSSLLLLPKLVTPSVTNEDVTFPHYPSHLNCPIPTVSPFELVLSCPICFELSTFGSKVKASYNCHKSVVRKALPAARVDTFYRTTIIFFWTALPLSLYANLALALQFAPRRVA